MLAGCSSDKRDSAEIKAETEQAEKFGKLQAQRLQPAEVTDTIEMEAILLDVRARETEIREMGENELADKYIESFLAELKSINPDLYNEITTE
jgi:hypothetical protein